MLIQININYNIKLILFIYQLIFFSTNLHNLPFLKDLVIDEDHDEYILLIYLFLYV